MSDPVFFPSAHAFGEWLAAHHATAAEVLVGYWKKGTGQPTLTWPESVDEALCYGWIDGVRRGVDADRYTIRFTPRKPRSIWSRVNVGRVAELRAQGRMKPAGEAAFARRTAERTGIYSAEQPHVDLGQHEAALRADPAAWAFWQAQPPGYRKTASWWVISAKREETRLKRLATLVADSAAGRRIALLVSPGRKT
jgi:uncharacterized protein YdeI (YjbR/CyaY-like superfamily)